MKHTSNPELIDEENPEWTEEDFRRARPAREVLPEIFSQEMPAKQQVILHLDTDVLAYFKAKGRDWQACLNETLREHMRKGE